MPSHTPSQYKAAIPIHHNAQIVVVLFYLDVSNVAGPYLVSLIDFHILEQIWLFLNPRIRLAGITVGV